MLCLAFIQLSIYPHNMDLSGAQLDEFMVLWKRAMKEDLPRDQARLIAARLFHLYRLLVRQPNA